MTHYTPCYGCARKAACPVLTGVRASIAGNARTISLVKVNCAKIYRSDFPNGSRVRVRPVDYSDPNPISSKAYRHMRGNIGTVFGWKANGKVLVLFDEAPCFNDDGEIEFCRMQSLEHRDIELIDEPARPECPTCSILLDVNGAPEKWRDSRQGEKGGCQFGGCEREPGFVAPPPWSGEESPF